MEVDSKGEILTHKDYDNSYNVTLVFFLLLALLYSLSDKMDTFIVIMLLLAIAIIFVLNYFKPRRISTFNKRSKKIEIVKTYAGKSIHTSISFNEVKQVELLDNSLFLDRGRKQVFLHLNDGKKIVVADTTSGYRSFSVDTYRQELATKLSEFLGVPLKVIKGELIRKE